MRILLLTGKGGVRKPTLAAATVCASAADGHRTPILSTDAAHSWLMRSTRRRRASPPR